jgi:prolyl-tRNA synthetase
VHLIQVEGNAKVVNTAKKLYSQLQKEKIEVLYDDRQKSPGEKFAESDLLGLPYRVVVSERTLKENAVELKERNKEKAKLVKIKDLTKLLS